MNNLRHSRSAWWNEANNRTPLWKKLLEITSIKQRVVFGFAMAGIVFFMVGWYIIYINERDAMLEKAYGHKYQPSTAEARPDILE
jgi:hypothetical protein